MLLAQHGWGKGDLITTGLEQGLVDGLILSPRDEAPDKMRGHVDALRDQFGSKVTVLFDPQFYAMTIADHKLGAIPDHYPRLSPGLSRAALSSPKTVRQAVESILKFQHSLDVSKLIAPSVLVSSFRDPWSQIALLLAEQSIEVAAGLASPAPLYVSLVMDENALLQQDAVDEFLDIVTALEGVSGFYLIVRPLDAGFPCVMQEGAVAGLLYMTHVLSAVNGFDVVAGYTDLIGTLLHAAGATHTAAGWFNGLRQFSLSRFQPASGGRAPRPRYASGPLLTPILVTPTLETIHRLRSVSDVLTGTQWDALFASMSPGRVPWPRRTQNLHHWATLRALATKVRAPRTARTRLAGAHELVTQAQGLFDHLRRRGVGFEVGESGRHLESWHRGLQAVRPLLGA